MAKHLKKEEGNTSSKKPVEVQQDKTNAISITDLAKKRLQKPVNDEIDNIEVRFEVRMTKDSLEAEVKYQGVRWYKMVSILAGIAGLVATVLNFFKG